MVTAIYKAVARGRLEVPVPSINGIPRRRAGRSCE